MDSKQTMLTLIVREADKTFERVGGGSKHWVRDCFAPALENAGLTLITISETELLRATIADLEARLATAEAEVVRLKEAGIPTLLWCTRCGVNLLGVPKGFYCATCGWRAE